MKGLTIGIGVGLATMLTASAVRAGCIGPTIMGKCEGTEVPWDTHPFGNRHPDPPAGFHWYWRGTEEYRRNPQDYNPFTGRDPHDSHWLDFHQGAGDLWNDD